MKLSATTLELQKRGVTIYEGHRAENLNNATVVITTAAAEASNPELQEADRRGLKVWQNAEVVGWLLNQKHLLAVAGTHGKTTTTGLVAFLLSQTGQDPTFYIGGVSRDLGVAGRAGKGQLAVVEADEYARRFLNYRPQAAVITNLEADHLDYYGSMEALEAAFAEFAANLPTGGTLYLCGDDRGALSLIEKVRRGVKVFTYGLSDQADWTASDLKTNRQGGFQFRLDRQGQSLGTVSLQLAGVHNVRNALGALAMVIEAVPGIAPQRFFDLAGQYRGASRRFELKGEARGLTVIDDYAHHPTEIKATLAAAKARYPQSRLVALFQPHTYTRTKALLDEFAGSFEEADRVALLEIFPARETDTLGISSASVIEKMQHGGKLAEPLTHANAAQVLGQILETGDVLLTLGAGDVWKVGEQILAQRQEQDRHDH